MGDFRIHQLQSKVRVWQYLFLFCLLLLNIVIWYGIVLYSPQKETDKTEYKIELINQQLVRVNNDTIQFEQIEEYIEKDNE